MIEPGRGGAYFALFSEIGIVLLITTLAGAGLGLWVDRQLHTVPVFVVVGFLGGAGLGAFAVWRLIERFLAGYDRKP
jgi:F0F1-type ATP synthase assembly protein I